MTTSTLERNSAAYHLRGEPVKTPVSRDLLRGCGFAEFHRQDSAVRMKATAGGRFRFLQGIVGKEVSDFSNEARRGKRLLHVVALQVNVGIDLVGDPIVALVPFEADIVRRRAYPERLSINLKRSFPDAQMVARFYDVDGFRVRPAVVLRTAKEIKLAHGHGHVRLFRNAFQHSVEDRVFDVRIHLYPASGGENPLHGRFRSEN